MYWKSQKQRGSSRSIVILYSDRLNAEHLDQLVGRLDLPDFEVFACSINTIEAKSETHLTIAALAKRLDEVVRQISNQYKIQFNDIAVVAQAVEGAVTAVWLHDYAPRIRCAILASPILGLTQESTRSPAGNVQADDAVFQASFPSHHRAGFQHALRRVVADAQAIQTPLQLLSRTSDELRGRNLADQFFQRLRSPLKEKHSVRSTETASSGLFDPAAVEKMRDFLARIFEEPSKRISLVNADQAGYTKDEFDEFQRPLPFFSRRRIRFALEKIAMRTVGYLSTGIRVGMRTGFDSGSTMDYVYRCQASGITWLGKAIDASYLNARGWLAIRVRRQNLQTYIAQMSDYLLAKGYPVVITDIAAGPGRYILDVVSQLKFRPERLFLRDYNAIDVHQGRTLLREYGLDDIGRFDQADAFDHHSLGSMRPRPTLAIACGIYELFPDNTMIRASLSGLADAIPSGGVLLYTGQPWHPELEYIARVLPSHRPRHRCLTRRRTQDEIDQLVESAGFVKIDQRIDEWGIFSVSVARKTG